MFYLALGEYEQAVPLGTRGTSVVVDNHPVQLVGTQDPCPERIGPICFPPEGFVPGPVELSGEHTYLVTGEFSAAVEDGVVGQYHVALVAESVELGHSDHRPEHGDERAHPRGTATTESTRERSSPTRRGEHVPRALDLTRCFHKPDTPVCCHQTTQCLREINKVSSDLKKTTHDWGTRLIHMSTRPRTIHSPTVRLRRLAAEMRRARLAAGYSQLGDAAKVLGWSGPKLSRLEDAKTRYIKPTDIDHLCDLYGIESTEARNALHALAQQGRERGWWSEYKDVFGDNVLPDFEAEASMIRTYEGLVIPGLLQTAEYIEEVFRGGRAHPDDLVDRHVSARLERQQILNRQRPPHFSAVVDEAALRRRVPTPGVMRDQLQHLLNMATRHNVDLQVLPFNAGPHAATTGSFVIMDFASEIDPSIVYTEIATGHVISEGTAVSQFVTMFDHVQAAALRASESVTFIKHLLAQESDHE